jgi:hypothetical protein
MPQSSFDIKLSKIIIMDYNSIELNDSDRHRNEIV